MAVASARAFFFITDLSLKPLQPPPPCHLLARPLLPAFSGTVLSLRRRPPAVVSCLISGVGGGGISDDVSTRKSGFSREFSVIASMLKQIEPLDTSVISQGISDSAKDSMKQTISTMLGLLPSDQFCVMVRVSKRPLNRLLISSVITGYTLWNAEYRISLMRNFDISLDTSKRLNFVEEDGVSTKHDESEGECSEVGVDCGDEDVERTNLQSLGDLSPEVLSYIQQMESELSTVKQELNAQKQENMQIENIRESNNDLLKYLRTLDSDMVTELSQPSSLEVEEVIQQLVQNILQRFFHEETTSHLIEESGIEGRANDEFGDTIGTSRDYLAKLLFWCMLLGHHLRGLENRLHLSCAVGLL
ncbi:hypothetical protein LguiA_017125 [Lonicera macranthoides]